MLNNILGKVTKPQHASVYNKVSRVKNLEGGHILLLFIDHTQNGTQ